MRLYELETDFDLTKKAKKKLFPSGLTFTWDPAKKQWLNPDGTQVKPDVHTDLMKSVGMDPRGNKLKPGMIDKIKGAWAKSGAGIDPKASMLGKVLGRVGAGLGNALSKAVRPKDADGDGQPDAAPDANGDGKPDAAPTAQQPAPLANFKFGDTRPGVGSSTDQALGKIIKQMRTFKPAQGAKPLPGHMISGIEDDLSKMRGNKDYAIRAGDAILKFAGKGYDVSALQQKWSQEAAIAKKQRIMQSKFTEELETLKKLAGI
jgi:hypothetical protein